jgi:60 kDa SS-A/Ro ribonucleoprotein
MPMGAMIRNLGKLSKLGIHDSVGADSKDFWVSIVEVRLKDDIALKRAKIHPLTLLIAFKQYKKGSSLKGKLEWDVNSRIKENSRNMFQ